MLVAIRAHSLVAWSRLEEAFCILRIQFVCDLRESEDARPGAQQQYCVCAYITRRHSAHCSLQSALQHPKQRFYRENPQVYILMLRAKPREKGHFARGHLVTILEELRALGSDVVKEKKKHRPGCLVRHSTYLILSINSSKLPDHSIHESDASLPFQPTRAKPSFV